MSGELTCPPDHKHGQSGTCYVTHKCRCAECRAGRTSTRAARDRAKLYGRYQSPWVDAEPVRAHLRALGEFGVGYRRVAMLADVGITAVRTILYGRTDSGPRAGEMPKRIERHKAERILALRPDMSLLADGTTVSARGAHRRLQALITQGWSQAKLAGMLGIAPSNFGTMLRADGVTVRLHRQIAELFDELWDQVPVATTRPQQIAVNRAVNYGRARRWVPPLGWDDIDFDESPPVAESKDTVDVMAVELAVAGEQIRLTRAERREAIRQLNGAGLSDVAIAARLGLAARSVLRIRVELHVPAAVAA